MSYEMNDFLELVVDQNASDLHLQVGQPPTLRISGSMVPIEGPELQPADTEQLMLSITPDAHQQTAKLQGGADFGFAYLERARFRVSILKAKGNYGLVLRQIPNKMFGLRDIGLPDKIRELLYRPRGLVLVTGPTGSGKSTTLASMINYINEHREGHIITIEDPIEYYHSHKRCIVTQREIGVDVPSFSEAIRRALRQDSRHHPRGRDARPRDHRGGHLGRRDRPPRFRHPAHQRRRQDYRPHRGCLPRQHEGYDPHAARVFDPGRHFPGALQKSRRRSHRWLRDHGQHDLHRGPHPRQQNLPHQLRHPDGRRPRHGQMDTHLMSLVNRELISPDEAAEKAQDPAAMRNKFTEMGLQLKPV